MPQEQQTDTITSGKTSRFSGMLRLILLLLVAAAGICWGLGGNSEKLPIRIGILHSQSGTMADSEKPLIVAARVAVAELNAAGGLLGQPIETVIADGASDPDVFAAEAERLITRERVTAVFGCWTSASRKAVKAVVEKYDNVLFYPVQFEGMELSDHVIYLGPTANQQVIPAVHWGGTRFGPRLLVVGSDYIYPRSVLEIIRDQCLIQGFELVGEVFLPLGSNDVKPMLDAIRIHQPDLILNLINGSSNKFFFQGRSGMAAEFRSIPVISFSIAEVEAEAIGRPLLQNTYACWNYFDSLDTPENKALKELFRRFAPGQSRITAPMEAVWSAVHLWAQAAREAGSVDPENVRYKISGLTLNSPGGRRVIDQHNRYCWLPAMIGKMLPNGYFQIVNDETDMICPDPFLITRKRKDWDGLLTGLKAEWQGRWQAEQR